MERKLPLHWIKLVFLAALLWILFRFLRLERSPGGTSYAAFYVFSTGLGLFLSTKRPLFSLLTATAVLGFIQKISVIKFSLQGMPFFVSDIFFYSNLSTLPVLIEYWRISLPIVGGLFLLGLALAFTFIREKPVFSSRLAQGIGGLGGAAIFYLLAGSFNQPFAFLEFDHDKDVLWFADKPHPSIYKFINSYTKMRFQLPKNLHLKTWPSPQDRKNLDLPSSSFNALQTVSLRKPEAKTQLQTQRPDLFAVLEESTFDPRIGLKCTAPECNFTLFTDPSHLASGGKLHVQVFGGATWTSEFAFLTGFSNNTFGPIGHYSHYTLSPHVVKTLPRYLKEFGYRSIGIYPLTGDFMNARNAYQLYGFDELHDAKELGFNWGTPDSVIFSKAMEVYRRTKERDPKTPVFFFILTIQQHGPHEHPLESLDKEFQRPLYPHLSQRGQLNLANYLHRLKKSSLAMENFEQRIQETGQEAVLVHFGDHQPALNQVFQTLDTGPEINRFYTYYRLKKFGRSPQFTPTQSKTEDLDICFLGAHLLKAAGLPLNDYFKANDLYHQQCRDNFNCSSVQDGGRLYAEYLSWVTHRLRALR